MLERAALSFGNPFWNFSVALYAASDAQEACLALQELSQIDVNVLLFAAWLGADRGVLLTDADFDLIDAETQSWFSSVIQPLRAVRRFLKPFREARSKELAAFAASSFRFELEAEEIEQAALFGVAESHWSAARGGTADCACANVEAYVARQLRSRFEQPKIVAAHLSQLLDALRKHLTLKEDCVGQGVCS